MAADTNSGVETTNTAETVIVVDTNTAAETSDADDVCSCVVDGVCSCVADDVCS